MSTSTRSCGMHEGIVGLWCDVFVICFKMLVFGGIDDLGELGYLFGKVIGREYMHEDWECKVPDMYGKIF